MVNEVDSNKFYQVPQPLIPEVQGISDDVANAVEAEAQGHNWNYEFTVIDDATVKDQITEKIADDLYLCLMKVKDQFYYNQADTLIRNIGNNAPVFEIKISDMDEQTKYELDHRWEDKNEINYILSQAAGRIFRNINESYFLLSIKQYLRVRLVP